MHARSLPLFAALLTSACVGDVSSHEEARAAWLKTQAILSDADAKIRGLAGAPAPDAVQERASSTPYSANQTFACPRGGTVTLRGNYYVDANTGDLIGHDYEAEFKRCMIDSLRIDGTIDDTLTIDGDGMTTSDQGELVFRGEVEGHCPIDMHDNPYTGTLCDFDAALALGG